MLRSSLKIVVAALCMLACAVSPAMADKVHLKDGRVLEGTVKSEGDGYVYFVISVGSIQHTELFTKDQIVKIERDSPAAASTAPAGEAKGAGEDQPAGKPVTISDGATRVTFLSIEDEVGMMLNADAIERSVELARPEKPDILVLVVESPGGALLEVEPLSDLIHKKLKKDFRVVGWIRSAISAASLTIFNCEELYMMREGNVGGTVAFTQGEGGNKAAEGARLEAILLAGEEISKRGKRDPLIMRAMQVWTVLSADIDENGQVTWHEGTQGEHLVNPENRILTLNSQDALKFGISKGTADSKDQLMALMGIKEWVEVGKKADEDQRAFREAVKGFNARVNELTAKYNLATQAASSGQNEKERALYVNRARNVLAEVRSLVRKAPSVEKYRGLDKEWFEAREEELRKMLERKPR